MTFQHSDTVDGTRFAFVKDQDNVQYCAVFFNNELLGVVKGKCDITMVTDDSDVQDVLKAIKNADNGLCGECRAEISKHCEH